MDRQHLIDLAYAAEQRHGLPKGMLVAQLHQESGDGTNNHNARTGATGVMQFMPATAAGMGFDPNDPVASIDKAAELQAQNLKGANGDVPTALKLYYAGPNRAGWKHDTNAYPGQVGGKWSMNDLVDDAMGATTAAPATAPPDAPPAMTDLVDEATGHTQGLTLNGTGAGGHTTPSTEQQRQANAAVLAVIQDKTLSPDDALQKAIAAGSQFGITPNPDDLRAAIKAHNAAFVTEPAKPIDTVTGHTISGDMQAGAAQGVKDTFGGLNEFASWADRNVAPLNMLDQAASAIAPGFAPNKIQGAVNQYNQGRDDYNAHYDSQYSDTGRMLGQVVSQAPLIAATGGIGAAVTEGAMGAEAANPLIQFMAGRGGSTISQRAASLGANGAATGALSGTLGSAANDGSAGQQAAMGALTGAVVGPVAGKLMGGYQGAGASLDPATAQLAQRAADMGINIRGSQLSGSPFVRTMDSVLARVPGSGIAADNAAQRAAGTAAIAGSFGARDLTPAGMSEARQALSSNYNDVAARTNLSLAPEAGSPFVDNLAAIRNDAEGAVGTDKLPAVDRLLDNVMSKVGPDGTMPGSSFKALTSKGAMLDKAIGSGDPGLSGVAKSIKGELNSALERSAAPEDVALLRDTDMKWKNMRTVEKLAAKSPDGQVSLQSLNQPVSSSFTNRAYTGAGKLGDLADLGQIIKDPGSSNTAERSQMFNLLTGAVKYGGGGLLGALGVQHGISPMEAMAAAGGAGAATAGGRLAGAALMRPGYRNRLIDAALNGNTAPPINYVPRALAAIGGNQINRLAGPDAANRPR